jgi:hypothetical protein
VSLWMITPLSSGRVAIRIRRPDDRARRIVLDETLADAVREEWRCTGCSGWFSRETVTLVESGRAVAGAPEIWAYCAPCAGAIPVCGGR